MTAEPLVDRLDQSAPEHESRPASGRGRSLVTLAVDIGGTRTRAAIVRDGVIGKRIT